MKAGAYVEFTGILPVELQKRKKKNSEKFKGIVVKKIGKTKVEVKPKYMRFTVVVKIADVMQIKESAFSKKQKFPDGKPAKKPTKKKIDTQKSVPIKKESVKKVAVEGDGPVKVVPKPNASKIFKDEVAEKIESGDKKAAEKPSLKPVMGGDLKPKEFPLNSEAVEKMPKKEVKEDYNWATDDPINSTQVEQELIDEQTSGSGMIRWSVIAFLLAAALGAYFLLR